MSEEKDSYSESKRNEAPALLSLCDQSLLCKSGLPYSERHSITTPSAPFLQLKFLASTEGIFSYTGGYVPP